MTSDRIADVIAACVAKCADVGVPVLGLVADNAANFQAANRSFEGLLVLRCAAHGIQLCVNDAFAEDAVAQIWDLAQRLREANRWPFPCITRWNSKYNLLVKIWSTKAVVTGFFDEKTLGALRLLTQALQPFAFATDIVQRDSATIFDWAVVFSHLTTLDSKDRFAKILRQCFLRRHDKLVSDALLVCCFFFPAFRRHATEWKSAKTRVRQVVLEAGQALAAAVFAAPPGTMASEWQRFVTSPPPIPAQETFTEREYLRWWSNLDSRFPHLSAFAKAVAQISPTEASCERAFSAVKFQLGKHRSNAQADLVEASVIVTSACQFEGLAFTESEPAESDNDNGDEPPEPALTRNRPEAEQRERRLTRSAAEIIVKAYVVLHDLEIISLHDPQADNMPCAQCDRARDGHRQQDGCKCQVCLRWFAFECLPLDSDDVVIIRTAAAWKCHECETRGH
jgi:hypothetical protein